MEQVAQEVMGSRRPEVEAQVEEVPMRVWKELEEGQQAPVVGKWRYQAMVVVMKGRESRNGEKWPLTHTGRYLKLGRRSDDGVQGQPRFTLSTVKNMIKPSHKALLLFIFRVLAIPKT